MLVGPYSPSGLKPKFMQPIELCKVCGRPMTKCVCHDTVIEEDDDEEEDWGAGEANPYGDDDYATPIS